MRFFHKFKSINYNFLCLVNSYVLSCEKKEKYTKSLNYLKKYKNAVDNNINIEISDKYPNKIWQCWFQGYDNMPAIIKVCTDSVKKFHKDDVIFLDGDNLSEYVDLPDYILEKHQKGIIPYANFSDIIRLYLLYKYGGCWVDSSVYLTDKISDDILCTDFFTFRSLKSHILNYTNSIEEFELYSNNLNSVIAIESPYFIRAKAGNEIIKGVLNLFFEYWKHENRVRDYLMIDKFFIITVLHNKNLKKQFLNMPTHYIENVLMLQHAQFEKFDNKIYEQITKTSSIHKMTHKNLHRNPYKDSFLKYILQAK